MAWNILLTGGFYSDVHKYLIETLELGAFNKSPSGIRIKTGSQIVIILYAYYDNVIELLHNDV